MTKEVQITFDCADPAGLAAFWADVLSYQVQPPPDGFDSWDAALESTGNRCRDSAERCDSDEAIGVARASRFTSSSGSASRS